MYLHFFLIDIRYFLGFRLVEHSQWAAVVLLHRAMPATFCSLSTLALERRAILMSVVPPLHHGL